MPTNLIVLRGMPDELMLIVECRSGVRYENQVGGLACWRGEQEGVLAPVDVERSTVVAIQNCPYPQGAISNVSQVKSGDVVYPVKIKVLDNDPRAGA